MERFVVQQASGLKPQLFCMLCGTAEAVPYKDSAVTTPAFKPVTRVVGFATKPDRLKRVPLKRQIDEEKDLTDEK